jgi:parvulin-like peptidyl-prolyl isomerase
MIFQKMRGNMKIVLYVVLAAFVLSLLWMGGVRLFDGGGSNTVIAKVSGKAITVEEFNQAFNQQLAFYQQYQGSVPRSVYNQLRYETLQQLINQQLLLQQVKKERIKVNKADIDSELQTIKDQFPTDADYQAQLKYSNMTEKQLRDNIKDNLAVNSLIELKSTYTVTDEDIVRAYEQVEASHILIEPVGEEKNFELAKALAEKVIAEIKGGKSFADAAKTYSADPGSKDNGGSLGYFTRDMMVKEFSDAAFALNVGEISGPVKSDYGYHVIKVTGKKVASGEDFESQKETLRTTLTQTKGDAQLQTWFEDVRAKAKIEINDPVMRAIDFMYAGLYPQAVSQYQEAVAANPYDPYIRLELGQLYQTLEDPDQALAEFKAAADLNSSDPEIYLMLGLAYMDRSMNLEAAEQFRKSSKLDLTNYQLHLSLLQLYTQMGLQTDAANEEDILNQIQKVYEAQQQAYEAQTQAQAELQKKLEQ